MRPYWRSFVLCAPFAVMAFLTVPFGERHAKPLPQALPLDRWDIPQLAAYLMEAGVNVRPQSAQKNGILRQSVYLTSSQKDWEELNCLIKDPTRIQQWRGIVFCTRESPSSGADLARQWGDQGLLVEPFVFYGDAELLARISAVLNRPAPSNAP